MNSVEGDSRGTLDDYYYNTTNGIKKEINSKDDDYLLRVDIDELTKYYVEKYSLPTLEIDSSRQNIMEKGKSITSRWESRIPLKIGIPILPKEDIDKVVSQTANPHLVGMQFRLDDGYLVTNLVISGEGQGVETNVESMLRHLKTVIDQKNHSVLSGNRKLEKEIKDYILLVKEKLLKEKQIVESVVQKLPIKLVKKESDFPVTELKVKKKIQPIMPEARKEAEPYLEKEQVDAVIELLRSQGRASEITPAAYSKMEEEQLRDIMLGMLNSVVEGDATGETFVKKGKTDIHLKLSIKGGILTGECKFWQGEKLYQETIDQHFGYITWRQNFAIQITFCKNKGFTEVVEKAVKATQQHATYIKDSYRKMDESYFITQHSFPEDPKKSVEVHHLLFNLYY